MATTKANQTRTAIAQFSAILAGLDHMTDGEVRRSVRNAMLPGKKYDQWYIVDQAEEWEDADQQILCAALTQLLDRGPDEGREEDEVLVRPACIFGEDQIFLRVLP